MENWKIAAFFAALLYGLHNVFTKFASGKISDHFGAFVLEATAAILILGYLIVLRYSGDHPIHFTKSGLTFSILAGASVAIGSILYFVIFRLGGNLSVAGPLILVGGVLVMTIVGIGMLGERLSLIHFLGLAFGFISLFLLTR